MRKDISNYLIHFTKGDDTEHAYQNLKRIIEGRCVIGSNGAIRGGYNCVCFSEAPIDSLSSGLINPDFYSRYSPFGILTTKKHVFDLGGRQAIYQPESEYHLLGEDHKWRHVRYEPPAVDFSWEREWRLKTEGFEFNEAVVSIVVPNRNLADRLISDHNEAETWKVLQYSQIMDDALAMQYEEPFDWEIILLKGT